MIESISLSVYSIVAFAVVAMTLLEGWASRGGWTVLRVAGLAAGPIWPLLLCAMLAHSLFAPRRMPVLTRSL
jgi:hypothetical protein